MALAVALGEFIEVESMQGLTREKHNVVCNVDNVVDRAATSGAYALSEPLGARANLDVANNAGHIALAQLIVGNGYIDKIFGLRGTFVLDTGQLDVCIAVVDGTYLGCNAHHRQAIRAVRGDLAVEHRVRKPIVVDKGHTNWSIGGQDHDASVVRSQAKLALGAVHAARYNTAQLALLDANIAREHSTNQSNYNVVALLKVLSTADDLQGLWRTRVADVLLANVDLGYPEMVGVGVSFLLENTPSNNLVEVGARALYSLDLGASSHELGLKLGWVVGQIDHCFKPFVGDAHLVCLSVATR